MLRIAIQAKGRLSEQSVSLFSEAGIQVAESKRKLVSRAEGFPLEVLYLRDDDIPQAVSMGVADVGIVGLNEVAEKGFSVEQIMELGFGGCRISLAVPKTVEYEGPEFFRGKRATVADILVYGKCRCVPHSKGLVCLNRSDDFKETRQGKISKKK